MRRPSTSIDRPTETRKLVKEKMKRHGARIATVPHGTFRRPAQKSNTRWNTPLITSPDSTFSFPFMYTRSPENQKHFAGPQDQACPLQALLDNMHFTPSCTIKDLLNCTSLCDQASDWHPTIFSVQSRAAGLGAILPPSWRGRVSEGWGAGKPSTNSRQAHGECANHGAASMLTPFCLRHLAGYGCKHERLFSGHKRTRTYCITHSQGRRIPRCLSPPNGT